MATTAAELITEVRYEIKDPTDGREPGFSDNELLTYLNDGVEDIVAWISGIWKYYWLRTDKVHEDTQDIVADTASYSLPADCYMVIAVAATDSDDNTTLLDSIDFARTFEAAANGYFLKEGKVWIYPTPDESVTDGLTIYYISRQTRLTSTSSDIPLPEEFRGMLKEYIVTKAKARQGERAADFATLYNKCRAQLAPLIARTNEGIESGLKIPRRKWI